MRGLKQGIIDLGCLCMFGGGSPPVRPVNVSKTQERPEVDHRGKFRARSVHKGVYSAGYLQDSYHCQEPQE